MNNNKDNEEGTNSNDNNNKKNDKSNENSDNFNFNNDFKVAKRGMKENKSETSFAGESWFLSSYLLSLEE